jgi:hypothetical protein
MITFDEGANMRVRIPPVTAMEDETLMLHLELRHDDDLKMSFEKEPDREERRTAAPKEWRTYHDAMHRLYPAKYDHAHNEE